MHPSNEKFITTKDASELSGYTSDYLSRLLRSGELSGKRIGHNWLIDSSSLEVFLEKQKERKMVRSRSLAHARTEEYKRHAAVQSDQTNAVRLTSDDFLAERELISTSVWSHVVALSVAFAVVFVGAAVARAGVPTAFANGIALVTGEASSGFAVIATDVAMRISHDIETTEQTVSKHSVRVATNAQRVSESFSLPSLAEPDVSFARMAISCTKTSCGAHEYARALGDGRVVTRGDTSLHFDVGTFAGNIAAIASAPQTIIASAQDAYLGLGVKMYSSVHASLIAYRSLIDHTGASLLGLASNTRDALRVTPKTIGAAVVDATHAAIGADVQLAYGAAKAAPTVARATVAFIGATGTALAESTAQVPHVAAAVFLKATSVPSSAAPAIAHAVFSSEYAGAAHFVAAADYVTSNYLALVNGTGSAAYHGTIAAQNIASAASFLPSTLQDTYLAALGKTAVAFDTLAHVQPVAAAVAAVTPALSTGQQVALVTYETIHGIFNKAAREVANLFAPSVTTNIAVAPIKQTVPTQATSSIAQRTAVPSTVVRTYPTYTTVIQGVTQATLDESLSSLRSGILGTVAGMVQPVATQGVTNMNTIQYVNMIQDLSNLTVRNGTFVGGSFSQGTSIAATTGTFSNLISSTAQFSTTTITGALTLTGDATANGQLSISGTVTAPNFVGTSTATSTFAGGIAVGNSQFVVQQSTGYVGVGTSSPGSLFAVGNVNGINLSTTATSTFGSTSGGINIASGCFAINGVCLGSGSGVVDIGTAGMFPYYAANGSTLAATSSIFITPTGNFGIGTTSPFSRLSVAGNGFFDGDLTATNVTATGTLSVSGNTTLAQATSTNFAITNLLSSLLKTNASGSIIPAVAGTDYLAPASLTGTYPLVYSGNNFSLAFGTTTSNTWGGTQTFTNAPTLATLSGLIGANNGVTYAVSTSSLDANITGNAGTVTNGVYTTTFGTLFDNRLSASSSIASITTLPNLSLPYGQLTGTPSSMASSTLLSDANTFSGINQFTNSSSVWSGKLGSLSGLIYGNSGALASAATTTASCAGTVSCSSFTILGSSPVTLTGSASATGLSTTTPWVIGDLAMVANNSAVTSVSTSTATIGLGLTYSGTWGNLIGGASGSLSVATSSLYSGTTGQFPYFSATNTITATSSLFLSANGSIGIGTTTPRGVLDVSPNGGDIYLGTKNVAGNIFLTNGRLRSAVNSFQIIGLDQSSTARPIYFGVANDTPLMTMSTSGSFGIGTTSPFANLSVMVGGTYASQAASSVFAIGSSTAGTATSTLFVVNSSGNVGINMTNPGAALDVTQTTSGTPLILRNSATAPINNGIVIRSDSSSNTAARNWAFLTNNTVYGDFAINQSNAFGGNPASAGTSLLYISASGNVGIGSTTPWGQLSASSTSANPAFAVQQNSTGAAAVFIGGNVGIGTTSPYKKLSIVGGDVQIGDASGSNNNNLIFVGKNGSTNTETNYIGFVNGYTDPVLSGKISFVRGTGGNDGQLAFSTATGGNILEAMRIDTFGFVGIGTTSPFAKLSVAGTSNGTKTLFAISTSTASATSTALTVDQNGNLSLLNGAGLSISGNTTLAQATTTNLAITNIISSLLKTNASGSIIPAVAGTDYLAPSSLTASYPILYSANNFSLAFGTTTSNTWGGTQTFTSAPVLGSLSGMIYGNSGTLASVATTTPTLGLGLSYSGTLGSFVGGASGSLTIATSSLYSGTTGQFPYFSGTNTLTATSSTFLAANGNLGIGTTSPYALLSVMAGTDYASHAATTLFSVASSSVGTATSTLFSINSAGQVGAQTAPLSDYLFSLAGNTTNNNSRIIDITQANNSAEDSAAISIVNTANSGTLTSGTRTISNASLTLTPTATLGNAGTINVYGTDNTLSLTSLALGDSVGGGTNVINAIGHNVTLSGNPLISDTNGGAASETLTFAGISSNIGLTPTVGSSNMGSETSNYYGGKFSNTTGVSAGVVSVGTFNAYGISATASSDMTRVSGTINIGSHYGGYFDATGKASNNYGLYVNSAATANNNYGLYINSVAAATTNYAIYSNAAAQSYFAGNVGIGTTTPNWSLQVAGTRPSFALTDAASGANQKHWLFSSMGGNLYVSSSSDAYATSTAPILTMATSSNVGIGTANPAQKLDVNGAVAISGTSVISSGRVFQNFSGIGQTQLTNATLDMNQSTGITIQNIASQAGATFTLKTANSSGNNNHIIFSPGGSEKMRIQENGFLSVASTTPWGLLSVNPSGITGPAFVVGSSTATNFVITNAGLVGVGTSTPGSLLSIGGTGTGWNFFDNGTTTSYAKGIDLKNGGCFAINGTCVGSGNGSGTVNSGTAGQIPYYAGAGTTLTATSSLFIATSGNIGVGSTTPWGMLSINPNGISGPAFVIGSSTQTLMSVSNSGFLSIGANAGNPTGIFTVDAQTSSTTIANLSIGNLSFDLNAGIVNLSDIPIDSTVASGTVESQTINIGGSPVLTAYGLADGSGNANTLYVGVGSTTPGYPLSVAGVVYSSTGGFRFPDGSTQTTAASGATSIQSGTTGQFPYYAAVGTSLTATSSIFLASSGNVGIGTTTPNWLLQVSGTRPSFALSDASAGANLKHWLFSSMGGNLYVGTSTDVYATSTPPAFAILNNGRIGIGTSTPGSLLSIGSTGTGWNFFDNGTTTSYAKGIDLKNGGCFAINGTCLGSGNGSGTVNSGTAGQFPYYAGAGTTLTATSSLFIATSGNLGLGTTTPNYRFTVNSNVNGLATTSQTGTIAQFGNADGVNTRVLIDSYAAVSTLDLRRADGTSASRSALAADDNMGQLNWFGYGATGYSAASRALIRGSAAEAWSDTNQGTYLSFLVTPKASIVPAEVLRLDSTGNIGIGTTTPNWLLQVAGTRPSFALSDASAGANLKHWLFSSMGGNLYVGTSTDAYATSSPSALTILNNGNIGVGTSTPFTTFGLVGTERIKTTTNSTNAFTIENASGTSTLAISTVDDSSNLLSIASSTGASFFEITASGYLGVGTTSPQAQFSIQNDQNAGTALRVDNNNTSTGAFSQVALYNGTTTSDVGYIASFGQGYTGVAAWQDAFVVRSSTGMNGGLKISSGAGGITFSASAATASDLFVNTTGYVGVASTTPMAPLSVAGDTALGGNLTIQTQGGGNSYFLVNDYGSYTKALFNGPGDLLGIQAETAASVFSFADKTATGNALGTAVMSLSLANRRVGIGTTSPETTLTVVGSICAARPAGTQTTACGTTAGAIYANSSTLTGGYDVAEMYPINDLTLAAGEVVSFDTAGSGNIARAQAADAPFLGVVSTNPGLTLGETTSSTRPLTLAGRVPTKVSAANGPIMVGDRLMLSSTTPGVAVKALHSGQTIGVALAAYSGADTGSVDVFISPQYWLAPQDMVVDATTGSVGIGTTTPNHTLTVDGDVGAIAFVNTSTREAKTDISYVNASTTEDMYNALLNIKVATYRYKIEDQSDPLRLGFIAEDVQQVAPEILSPDGKGVDLYKMATFTLSGVQTLASKMNAQDVRITALETRVKALEDGSVSTGSSSPVTFSTSTLASALSGFGVLIEKGVAQFNTLVFRQLVASKDADGTSSAGSVVILSGNTVAQVNNSLVLPSTKIFVTFNAQLTGSWWVSDKTSGSFRVVLSDPQTTDVSFDYFLVQTEGQIATSTPSGVSGVTQSSGPDTVAPVITVIGDNPFHVSVGGTFTDPGVTVTDSVDGTDPIVTFINGLQQEVNASTIDTASPTTYIITYQATDKAGNMATARRSVIVGNPDGTVTTNSTNTSSSTPADTTPPVVTLTGSAAMELTVGDTFTDPGAIAADDVDGDLTSKITETGSVDTATTGLYTLTYSATDAAGNTGSASRVITVTTATSSPI